jgi:hypothetical protein
MANSLLELIQGYHGGQERADQLGLLEEYIEEQKRPTPFPRALEEPNLIPLALDPELGPSMRSIVDDDTLKSRIYDFVEPAMTHNIPEGRMEGLLNWRNLVGGVADVVGKTIDKTQSPTFGDAAIATAEIAGMGFPKIVSQYVKNLRNYVPGFYAGQEALGAGRNAALGLLDTVKDFGRQFYKNTPISKGTENTLREEFANYQALQALGREGGFTDEINAGMRASARKIHGQLGQNIVHGRMMGEAPEILRKWAEKNFGEELPFDRSLSKLMFDDVDSDLIYDMSNEAWGGVGGGFIGKAPSDALFINKKNTRVAGNSFNDIVSSRQFSTLRRLNAKHSPKSAEEWLMVLDEYDPNWSKNLAIPRRSVVQGTDGVLFQFSPAGKQDYLLGGFNAIIKVNKDGTAKMFGTDKQDIFGQKIPGSADAIVGIGDQKAVNFGGKKDAKLKSEPVPKYKPPKQAEGREVTIESAKQSQKKQKKKQEYKYLSNEDEADIYTILGSVDAISPSRIGASGSLAAALGIIGSPYED